MKSRTWMWMTVVSLFAALAIPAQARIVYTPVNVNLPTNGYYAIDLNHDGITDFTFQSVSGLWIVPFSGWLPHVLKTSNRRAAGGIVGSD